ncbi:signal recognition particle protein Sec65 [Niveomyces insectorum RCEF 264]|uniref:Signal recognition particle protein Sec65 n=1 Tax=Niveomyces insectorum RCEF 264 TaxID=1081102 RepID=A0A162JDA7_9HYPO|nr:signal recognition particle protein Sec65 [Niveomyces insectorum RCEF 264]
MSRHPRIEEVEDSDDAISDPSEGDIDDFVETDILRRVEPKAKAAAAAASSDDDDDDDDDDDNDHHHPLAQPSSSAGTRPAVNATAAAVGPPAGYTGFPALYPVYFDRDRSRAEGRRVRRALAVANPLARDIVAACAALGLRTVFEPTKTHPKDWANPGRVRPYPRPAVPRGWKLPALVPYLSPAMTGGGVSENLFQDVMKEMQGAGGGGGGPGGMGGLPGLGGGAGGGGGSSGDAKKSKKGKGRA